MTFPDESQGILSDGKGNGAFADAGRLAKGRADIWMKIVDVNGGIEGFEITSCEATVTLPGLWGKDMHEVGAKLDAVTWPEQADGLRRRSIWASKESARKTP